MIINIPLQIDDAAIEGKLVEDYKTKVLERVEERIDKALKEHDDNYWGYRKTAQSGLDNLISNEISNRITEFLNENRDKIIETAAEDLGKRLSRSKRGKEILEGLNK